MEFSDYAETRTPADNLVDLLIPVSKGGVSRSVDEDLLNPHRGSYAGTTSFPVTGGRYTDGAPMRGDRWKLLNELTINGTDIYAAGSVIEADEHEPGQDTTKWTKYAAQL